MKAEERKSLEQNSLVQGLEEAYEGIKKGPSSTFLYWAIGIVAVLLVLGLFRYFMMSSETITSNRWASLSQAVFAPQVEALAAKSEWQDTPQGRLARFKEARLEMSTGLRELGINPKSGQEHLLNAAGHYEALIKASARVPLLHQEALWGAARARESLGELDKAREHYQKLVKEYEKTALGEDAARQLKRLDDPANERDLAELRKLFGS